MGERLRLQLDLEQNPEAAPFDVPCLVCQEKDCEYGFLTKYRNRLTFHGIHGLCAQPFVVTAPEVEPPADFS
jgi:hypothetical protein